jgi:hypothetical protein
MMRIKPNIFHHTTIKMFTAVCLVFFLMAVWCGCTSKYGTLKQSFKITEIFETNQILSDHVYYYNGFQHIPYAIIAINHEYTLRASGWNKIKLTPILLNQLTDRMRNVYTPMPQGARIMGPNGERLGIWYSPRRLTAVRLASDGRILIATPAPPEVQGIR